MTDGTDRRDRPTRRAVLRKGAVAAGALGVGAPALSTTARASYCPRPVDHWRTSDWPNTVWDQRRTTVEKLNENVPGVNFGTPEDWRSFLGERATGDRGRRLAFQLVATIVNFQGVPSRACWDTAVEDVDGDGEAETIAAVKELAQRWLRASNFPDEQHFWIVQDAPAEDGEALRDVLEAFNNRWLDVEDCRCESGDPRDDEGSASMSTGRREQLEEFSATEV